MRSLPCLIAALTAPILFLVLSMDGTGVAKWDGAFCGRKRNSESAISISDATVTEIDRQEHDVTRCEKLTFSDLVELIERRFRVPVGGGRATDSAMTIQRQVRLKPATIERLKRIAAAIGDRGGPHLGHMQVAAALLELAWHET